jgi:protein-arginine kinase activator protein McsA
MLETSSTPPLCEVCRSRPAKNFICQIIHGVQTNRSLCDECANADAILDSASFANIHQAKCYYCGDKAASGSMNQAWELPSRQQQMHYTCLRCMNLYNQFYLPALSNIRSGMSPEELCQHLELVLRETDDRVRQAIARA